jgi:hypothetical protein
MVYGTKALGERETIKNLTFAIVDVISIISIWRRPLPPQASFWLS